MSALDHQRPVDAGLELADGTIVSARRGGLRDLDALHTLAAREGVVCDDLELARLLRSDPAQRLVLCATTPADGEELVLGVGVIELRSITTMPTLILVDPAYGQPLGLWLVELLVEQARAAA